MLNIFYQLLTGPLDSGFKSRLNFLFTVGAVLRFYCPCMQFNNFRYYANYAMFFLRLQKACGVKEALKTRG